MSTNTEPAEAAAIQQRMSELRAEMKGDVDALVSSTEDLADWRKYVRAQPLLCVGAAALVGFLLAPARRRPQPVAEAATKAGVAGGIGGALVGALATALANRAAMQLGEYVLNRMNQSQSASSTDEFRND
jgi:uncharacterized protein YgbK (DUF1537 family)